jgi:hypothetical protein
VALKGQERNEAVVEKVFWQELGLSKALDDIGKLSGSMAGVKVC